jgi:hypothetical protein
MIQIDIARLYLNKKEKPGNSGFEDPQFEADMVSFGEWVKGYSWCACFMQMVFRKAYPDRAGEFKKLFDPSTRKTFDNFKAAGYSVLQTPVLGSLVIWSEYANGKATYLGHAGLVTKVIDKQTFTSIEGNTSGGSGSRNGDRVFEHTRNLTVKPNGLNVLGFIVV